MRKQTAAAIATAATVGATALVWAAPANADLTTRCVGEGGAVTVPGDLVVPRGESCDLTGTTVEGNVRVAPDANLVATDATFNGRVNVAENGYFEAVGSSVADRVVLRGAYGSYLDSSELADRVITRPGGESAIGGFVYTFEASLADNLVSRSGELFLESTDVAGTINSVDSLYTDVYESFVDGRLVVRNNELGAVVCASAVQGVSRFLDNAEVVQIGSNGPFADCEGGSYWGDDVAANGTTGDVYVDNNIVNGDLTLRNNDPVAQLGPNNMVRGEINGEYEDWNGSAAQSMATMRQSPNSAAQRDATIENKVEQRHAEAVKGAAKAGKADLGG